MDILLPLLAFLFGSLIVSAVAMWMLPSRAVAIDRRLQEVTSADGETASDRPRYEAFIGWLQRVGERVPGSPKEMSKLRLRLVHAGLRREEALPILFGIRVVLALALCAVFATPLFLRPNMMLALAGLGVGYLLPGMAVARMARRRQHRIRLALADATFYQGTSIA